MSSNSKHHPLEVLKNSFGHTHFRHNQAEIINEVLAGRDTLAILPTGGGKSLCYQIPALIFEGITLVVSPLISLMQDQVSGLKEVGIKASFLNSNQSYEERQKVEHDLVNGDVKIVYLSPEGILSGATWEFLSQLDISLVAIDEAHCVSQWGHEFREDYTRLHLLKNEFPATPFLALTATADQITREDIVAQLKMSRPKTFLSTFDRPNIQYHVQIKKNEFEQLAYFLNSQNKNDTGIIYCLSRKKVEDITKKLQKSGWPAHCYHAGLSRAQRDKTYREFTSGKRVIIVATIAFGMGIDRPDVRFVVHLDMPKNIEAYYQETGRAGRDGQPAIAWMIYGANDYFKLAQMIENSALKGPQLTSSREKLTRMLSFCEEVGCRRKSLLEYFGEPSIDCGNCDECLVKTEMIDSTVDAQKMISTIFKTGQYFGSGHIIDVIRGSKSQKVLNKRHHQLSVYGIGKERSKEYWSTLIRQLVVKKYICVTNSEFRSLKLNQSCQEILTQGESFFMRKEIAKKYEKKNPPVRKRDSIYDEIGNHQLFEILREHRRELAKAKKIPPYIVFSDHSLKDMCAILPRNKDEFLMVNGVGQKKCQEYSDSFLPLISPFTN
jgi:ATP-dependent DNA helicase RecQ